MLQQFTWTDFMLAALPLVAGWYAWLFFVFNQGKGQRMIGVESARYNAFGGTGAADASALMQKVIPGSQAQDDLMGKPRMPQGMTRVVASDFVFAHGQTDEDREEPGLVLDVITEMKELFEILAKEDGTKPDFFRLIAAVKEAYPGIGTHPGIAVINAYVVEHAPFLISVQELESLWD